MTKHAIDHDLCQALSLLGLGCVTIEDGAGPWLLDLRAASILGVETNSVDFDLEALAVITHPEDVDKVRHAFDAISGGVNLNLRVGGQDGASWTLVQAAGGGNSAIVVLKDITAQRLSEVERSRMIELFTETSQMEALGTLAGGIAHEINNPTQFIGDNLKFIADAIGGLFAVALEAERAAKDGTDWDKVAQLVTKIPVSLLAKEIPAAARQAMDGVERIGNIVQAIREFCYPGVKTPTPLSLNHLIEIAVTVTRNKWKYGATLDLDLDQDIPMIVAVEGEIYQILVNLIVNAVQSIAQAAKPELGRITIATRRADKMVALNVVDTGVGIAPENKKRIFDMFFTTKAPGQGTGQGLAITQAIVYRHGGKIWVESNPGEGAAFHILLPALEEP